MKSNHTGSYPAIDILIVEDSETQANQLGHLLSCDGYSVRIAKNGRLGLAAARAKRPALIVSDIAMPEMDGFEMCRELKKDQSLCDVPIILLTALNSLYDVIKSLDCGADNFIRKPFDGKYLLDRVRVILANREFRSNEKVQLGMQVKLGGQTHFITAERQQIFDLLISTYEEAIKMAEELSAQQKQIAHSYQALEGLYKIAEALNPAITEKTVSKMALDRVLDLPGVIGACIKLDTPDGGFRVTAVSNFGESQTYLEACSDCSCRRKLQAGELKTAELIEDCAALRAGQSTRNTDASHISVPLSTGPRTFGVLNLRGSQTSALLEENYQILNAVGNQIAVALERAHLYANMEGLVKERTEALQTERNLLSGVINTSGALVILTDANGRVVMFNHASEKTLGWQFDEVKNRVCWDLFLKEDSARVMKNNFEKGNLIDLPSQVRSEMIARDGSTRYVIWSMTVLKNAAEEVEYVLGTGVDVTELRNAEEKVQYLSNFDVLTGLPNRILLRDRVKQLQEKVIAGKSVMGFLLIDFVRLPLIRESLGNSMEQALLRQIASRFKDWLSSEDSVARYGDTSFAVVAMRQKPKDLSTAAGQILTMMETPFVYDGHELHIEVNVGIAIYPNDGDEYESLSQGAEAAMRRASRNKNERYEFYRPELNRGASQRLRFESELRRALERDQLKIHYQPQVDLNTGQIVGMEALLRWQHPIWGSVSPDRFIPVAEETGLIIPIGRWVLRTACTQAANWRTAGLGDLRIAVNLSAREFSQPDLVKAVAAVLEESGLPPQQLDLELTESLLINDREYAIEVLDGLKALGVKLSVDDFGTGYSSLSYLKRFPVDMLKIDRSFVQEISHYSNDAAISDAIIAMAHSLGIGVIAEGVESDVQCEVLAGKLCDEIQGSLFSDALPATEVEQLLRSGKTLPGHLLRTHRRPRTLLLVDDEPNILSALRRHLRSAGYQVLTAASGSDGLDVLARNQVDVIVSDQRMPGMTGVDFLRTVKQLYPETVRIVLSGFTELQAVTDAVNEGAIYKFLTKPWDDGQLREHIAEAFAHKEMADENRRLNLEVRAANQGLATANRKLENVLKQQEQQIKQGGITLDIVREVLQHVPVPIIGLDDDLIVTFANAAAHRLFLDAGPLLGSDAQDLMPELMSAIEELAEGQTTVTALAGCRFAVTYRRMGNGTHSRGMLVTLTPSLQRPPCAVSPMAEPMPGVSDT